MTWDVRRLQLAHRAGTLVQRAIKRGELVRAAACENCAATNVFIEAAHANYAQPLSVRWLCRSCHRRWDKLHPKTTMPGALNLLETKANRNKSKTHCPQGHAYTVANTYRTPTVGYRRCRMCAILSDRRRRNG